MDFSLQKASMWKRLAAWLLDTMLVCVLATGVAFTLSSLLGYDGYSRTMEQAYDKYETQYGVVFDITQEQYEAMTAAEKENYDAAYDALTADEEAMAAYNMLVNLMMIITTGGILVAVMVWEFVLPLILKNGQTLGKKAFGICLVRTDGVRVNNLQLFVRSLLGKFAIETMIPVCVLLMMFWGVTGLLGLALLIGLLIAQVVCMCVSKTNAAIHDLMAGTAAVDMHSQRIFASTEELIAMQKQAAAERAARQAY